MYFKKIGVCIILSLMVQMLFAEDLDDRLRNLKRDMQQIYIETPMQSSGAGFQSGNPDLKRKNWFLTAEALYWHTKVGGTEWALVLDSGVLPQKGSVKDVDFDWDWGLRVGVGYVLPHDQWDLYLTYTYFETSDTGSVHEDFVTPLGTAAPGPSGRSDGKIDWHIDYDMIDFVVGKSYFISSNLSVYPTIGLKNTWLDQKVTVRISDFIDVPHTLLPIVGRIDISVKHHCKFLGIGPQGGVDMFWYFSKNFCLSTQFTGALLYGYFKQTERDSIFAVFTTTEPISTSAKIASRFHRFVPYAKLLIGASWGTYLNQKRQYVDLGIAYEVQYYWRVGQCFTGDDFPIITSTPQQTLRFYVANISEDLSFYGVVLRARLDF